MQIRYYVIIEIWESIYDFQTDHVFQMSQIKQGIRSERRFPSVKESLYMEIYDLYW